MELESKYREEELNNNNDLRGQIDPLEMQVEERNRQKL